MAAGITLTMEDLNEKPDDALKHAEDLLMQMQKGNEEQVAHLLEYINTAKEGLLFQEVGKMTRQLHDALESFRSDSRLDSLTEQDIPDARERLTYVIEMTQKSADRTLGAVEETLPLAEKISNRAGELSATWKKFRRRELSADQFRELSANIELFLEDIDTDAAVMKNNLNEVLMAQDYQDLSGQIINRVITLVEEVEGNLVDLIRLTGEQLFPEKKEAVVNAIEAEGPQIPGIGKADVMASQDDVDDLLSSLGF